MKAEAPLRPFGYVPPADVTDVLVRVCAWCGVQMGTQHAPGAGGAVSHGLCAGCLQTWRTQGAEARVQAGPWLEVTLRAPVEGVPGAAESSVNHVAGRLEAALPEPWRLHHVRFVP